MVCRPNSILWGLVGLVGFPLGLAAQEWTLASHPDFEVGGASDDPRYALSVVVGGTRLGDGTVVVADRLSYGLKMFSSAGEFVRAVGRKGEGPEEYERIRGIGRCAAGRIVAYDLNWDEVRYDEALDFVGTRAAEIEELGTTPYQSTCNEAGFVLASGWGDLRGQFARGYFQATAPVVLAKDGDLVYDFGERLSSERVGSSSGDGPGGSGPHPFGRQTSVALGLSRAYLGSAAEYLVEVYDLTGRRLPDITWSGPDLSMTRDDLDALADGVVEAAAPSRRPRLRRMYEGLPLLEQFPAYDRLLTDRSNQLWVRYFSRPDATATKWIVFDEDGRLLANVSLPLRATLLEAGDEYVLLSELDEFDLPTVRVYSLVKP
jgi:6-bladed beta-propeller protein